MALELFEKPLGDGFICGACIVYPVAYIPGPGYILEAVMHQEVCPVCAGARGRMTRKAIDYECFVPCHRCDGQGWIKPDATLP